MCFRCQRSAKVHGAGFLVHMQLLGHQHEVVNKVVFTAEVEGIGKGEVAVLMYHHQHLSMSYQYGDMIARPTMRLNGSQQPTDYMMGMGNGHRNILQWQARLGDGKSYLDIVFYGVQLPLCICSGLQEGM